MCAAPTIAAKPEGTAAAMLQETSSAAFPLRVHLHFASPPAKTCPRSGPSAGGSSHPSKGNGFSAPAGPDLERRPHPSCGALSGVAARRGPCLVRRLAPSPLDLFEPVGAHRDTQSLFGAHKEKDARKETSPRLKSTASAPRDKNGEAFPAAPSRSADRCADKGSSRFLPRLAKRTMVPPKVLQRRTPAGAGLAGGEGQRKSIPAPETCAANRLNPCRASALPFAARRWLTTGWPMGGVPRTGSPLMRSKQPSPL